MPSPLSPVIEAAESQNSRSQSPVDALVEWPFEPFPPPPLDGNWIPKYGPPPPSKFPLPFSQVPSDLTLNPPIMALTYPPPPPLSEDPTWLNQMVADVTRQRAHLQTCLSEARADAANAYAEVGLADAELEEERAMMQAFLDVVASVAGKGFVRRMLEDVGQSVEEMSRPRGNDEDSESGSSSPSRSNPSPP